MTPAERTGSPSSVKPAAPASARSAISVSRSPSCPTVIAAMKPVGMRASTRARSRSERSTGAESTTGVGVRLGEDRAEAARRRRARARVDVLLVLAPGGPEVDVRVDEGRECVKALGLDDLAALGSARSWG